MPSERDTDRLIDIRDHIALARQFVGASHDDFVRDKTSVLAVTRCLEIVSEASRHLDRNWKTAHAEVPWAQIAAAGNVYRHDDPPVHPQRVWHTVQNALPMLAAIVDAELRVRGISPE